MASDPKHVFQGRRVLVYEIKLSTAPFHETISLFLCNSFTILFEFKHDEFEREQEGTGILGVEPAPRGGSRGETDRWGRPAPVAFLRGPFADVQARCNLF